MKTLLLALLLLSSFAYGQNITQSSNASILDQDFRKPLKIGDEIQVNINTAHPYNLSGAQGLVFEEEFFSKNASYIKLYFKNFDLGPDDYVEVSSPATGESFIYGGQGKIIDANMTMISDFWSNVILADRVIVRLYSQAASNNYGFEIATVAYGYTHQQIEQIIDQKSICGGDEKEPVICYNGTDMYTKGKAVCRLLIGGSSLCTGWLLGCDGHLMTNNHCVGSASAAANTDFMFNYQYTNCNGTGNSSSDVVASSASFIKTSSSLDYTLLKLPTNPTNTYGYLSLSSVAPVVGDRIYIVGHPGGRRKEITVKTDQGGDANGNAQVNQITGTGLRYYADTEGGSSGSPVLSYNSNLVVGIHNTGGCTNGSSGRSDQLISHIGSDMPNCGVDNGGGTPPPNPSCASTVSSFPYNQGFENTFGSWSQSTSDNFNWSLRSGGTPSSNTGPSAASSGTYYAYMESSYPNYSNKTAILNSPCLDLSNVNNPSLTFKYHMYGSTNMGNLKLEASTDGTTWNSIWSKAGNQGNSWKTATVDLSAYASATALRLRFNGTTGTTWQGDMAIDALSITSGGGSGPCVNVTQTFVFDNYPEETSWNIKNSAGSIVASGGTYGSQPDGSTLAINACLDPGCYTLTVNDSYGDGICCAYGNGSYTLTNTATGATLASGGSFTSTDVKNFCVGSESESSSIDATTSTDIGTFLNVAPNPFSDYLEVSTNIENVTQYTVHNLQGQRIQSGTIDNKTIHLESLDAGVYFISFVTDKKQIVRKIVKQ